MKPRADAAEKALQAQTQLYQAAEAEFSKPTDSQAKIVDPKWHRNGGKRIEELMANTHLIDARYLIALAQLGGTVPSWEDTPKVAKMEQRHNVTYASTM